MFINNAKTWGHFAPQAYVIKALSHIYRYFAYSSFFWNSLSTFVKGGEDSLDGWTIILIFRNKKAWNVIHCLSETVKIIVFIIRTLSGRYKNRIQTADLLIGLNKGLGLLNMLKIGNFLTRAIISRSKHLLIPFLWWRLSYHDISVRTQWNLIY